MATTLPNPTRMELTRLKRKLTTALRGHKLLKDKRDELMRQFLDLVRENKALRERVEAGLAQCNQNFVLARAGMSDEELNTAMMAPKQEVLLEADSRNVMSVDVPVFRYKTRTSDPADIYAYGFAFTSADLDDAVQSLADLLPDLLRLAEVEKSCQLMAAEIEKTRRRVNAGTCDDPRNAAADPLYHHEAGRKRAQHPDPPDEGEGYDAGADPPLPREKRRKIRRRVIPCGACSRCFWPKSTCCFFELPKKTALGKRSFLFQF